MTGEFKRAKANFFLLFQSNLPFLMLVHAVLVTKGL